MPWASFVNSPVADTLEQVAGRWVLEILNLPRGSAVSFGTSASACGLACLTAARRTLLARQGWDFDQQGLMGAPEIRVVVPASTHITIKKALRTLGRAGVADLVDRHCRQAARLGEGLRANGFEVLNRVVLNQVLFRLDTDESTAALQATAAASGKLWFGPTVWQGRPALRLSVSSWRTTDEYIEGAIRHLVETKTGLES